MLNTPCFQHIMRLDSPKVGLHHRLQSCANFNRQQVNRNTDAAKEKIPIYISGRLNQSTRPRNILRHGSPVSLPQSSLCWNSNWKPHGRRPQERRPKQQLAGHIVYHSIEIPAAKLFCKASLLPVLRFWFFFSLPQTNKFRLLLTRASVTDRTPPVWNKKPHDTVGVSKKCPLWMV